MSTSSRVAVVAPQESAPEEGRTTVAPQQSGTPQQSDTPQQSRTRQLRWSARARSSTGARLAGAVVVTSLLATGCGFNLYDVPLPGGADLGSSPYEVTIQFADVLDLVPQSAVKVDDVPVGRVKSISLGQDGWSADVVVLVNGDVDLPANAGAALKQSSLLGEKFVDLEQPASNPSRDRLAAGATIPLERTQRSVELEEAFGALSLLLNGGGVAQLQSIIQELNKALKGNEPEVRSLLTNLDTLVSGLDDQRSEITRALNGLNTLTATVDRQRGEIANALDTLPAGIQVLNEQEPQFVALLQALQNLGVVATDVINKTQDNTIADLQALTPTLRSLAAAGSDLPNALQILGTYPFTDDAVQGIKGSSTNLYINADLQLGDLLSNLSGGSTPGLGGGTGSGTGSGSTLPTLPGLGSIPSVTGLVNGLSSAVQGLTGSLTGGAVGGLTGGLTNGLTGGTGSSGATGSSAGTGSSGSSGATGSSGVLGGLVGGLLGGSGQ